MKGKLRVLIAAPTMARGGTERQLVYLASALDPAEVEVVFVLLAPDGPLEADLVATGVRVVKPERARERPLRTLVQAQLIAHQIKSWRPHVVHSFLSEPHFAAALGVVLAGKPHPALVHGRRSTNFYALKRPIASALERALHGRCAALIGNSKAIAAELMDECRTPERVAVIHNGLPLMKLDAARPSRNAARELLGIGHDVFVMAVVANLYEYKRHADVLSALEKVRGQLPKDWCLLLAGRDAGQRELLERQAQEANLSGVVFLDEMPDPAIVHAAADVEVLVSLQEGFSNAVLEAMAAGVPTIVSSSGGNPDAVMHEETGLIVPPRDPDKLAAAILGLALDPTLRRRLGTAARSRVGRCFSIEQCAARYVLLWRGLAEGRPLPIADWLRLAAC